MLRSRRTTTSRFPGPDLRFAVAALIGTAVLCLGAARAGATTIGNAGSPVPGSPTPVAPGHGHAPPPKSAHAYAGGGVLAFGAAPSLSRGTTSPTALGSPVTSMASTLDGGGYWIATASGDVLTYGDAPFFGSLSSLGMSTYAPIVAMAATPDGAGYWLLGQDGGVFTFGDAGYFGSTGNLVLEQPVVGMAPSPDGKGYWLVAADGGIFAYGDAHFYGSAATLGLDAAISGISPSGDGKGYWLVAQDGGVLSYGDAHYYGSAFGDDSIGNYNAIVVNIARTTDGKGYWLADSAGAIFPFGDATDLGSEDGQLPATPVSDIVASSGHDGYWMLAPDSWNYTFDSPQAPSPVPQARQIVAIAESQVKANPSTHGDFCNPYGPCEAWCSIFSTWIWQQAGIDVPTYPFTGDVYTWAAQNGEVLPGSATPAPGDVVLYGYSPAQGQSLHTGMVVQVWPNGAIVSIEGDSGPDTDGWYGVVINGPFLPGDPWAYYEYPVYAYAQPNP